MAHGTPASDRADPVTLLEASSLGRIPELVPVRYGRMAQSPFAFFRGARSSRRAISLTPSTGCAFKCAATATS